MTGGPGTAIRNACWGTVGVCWPSGTRVSCDWSRDSPERHLVSPWGCRSYRLPSPMLSRQRSSYNNTWTQYTHFNTLLSELVRNVLLERPLNFCSCTTWFLDLYDLVRNNTAWLRSIKSQSYKQVSPERIVMDLESEVMRGGGSIPTRGYILSLGFFFVFMQ